jgi:Nif-specific regulatory protein
MRPASDDYFYLTVTEGARRGSLFPLRVEGPNRVGRGTECEVRLIDPGCSREHAVVTRESDGWWLRDHASRNGTYHNDEPIQAARLKEGDRIRVGGMELEFCRSDDPPTVVANRADFQLPEFAQETPVEAEDATQRLFRALENAEFAKDLLVAYQLSVKLLELEDPEAVVRASLDLLLGQTQATQAAFLWLADDGQLRPQLTLPPGRRTDGLSKELPVAALEKGRAIWISAPAGDELLERPREESRRTADEICVPLIKSQETLGVVQLSRKSSPFRQQDLDFSISVANLMALALVRTRRGASLKADHQRLATKAADFRELVGNSPAMRLLKERITRVACARGSVLIRGESGCGKELVARAIHASGPRRDRPLLSLNCAAIPADLIESQLFGHAKGAFTGADKDYQGYFQQADTGTLFLDEIGELPLEGQAKLLRILEGHPFSPVGDTREVRVDVRVLAATNRDLKEFVQQKKFRADLYFRLSVFELEIPPLRERGDDLGLLVDFFFDHFRTLHGRPALELAADARQKLLDYSWPGNVRQLRNVIDSAVVMADGNRITAFDLGIHAASMNDRPQSLRLDEWEKSLIQDALARTRGKIPEAALLLGIGRATLYRKIDEYGIAR